MNCKIYLLLPALLFICCHSEKKDEMNFDDIIQSEPHIAGKQAYLNSPYITAGDRVYMVGDQDGSFPEIGWHIKGEMGGIWNHPIKLMDGFDAQIDWEDTTVLLDSADVFVNYPFANSHEYRIKDKNMIVKRRQFVPDGKEGISIQYVFENNGADVKRFTFSLDGHSDLRPTWLGEKTKMIDAQDEAEFLQDQDAWLVKDKNNPWFVLFGTDQKSVTHSTIDKNLAGLGITNRLEYKIVIPSEETYAINFTIAGSYRSKEAVLENFKDIKSSAKTYLLDKQRRYEKIENQSKLTIPDKKIEEAFLWLKYNCDWLVRSVPEIGTGITAGIPDYPWWFGVDSEYALKGYMAIGQQDAVYKTIHLLDSVSNAINGNGKIIHEMSTNGAVFNKGNINETPQFASLIWEVYKWNGDKIFLKKYFPTIKKGLNWLLTENDANKNLFPDGFGMMEIHGLNSEMVDVATYTQRAFSDASKMASELDNEKLSIEYQKIADTLKTKINTEFWSKEFNSYADFLGTDTQALHLIEDAIIRADTLKKPWAVSELERTKKEILANPSEKARPFVLHHNWVVNTPMEMKIADSTKAIKALKTAESFVNPFGVFVTGIDRDASAGSDEGSFKGSKMFSYTGAVMTLPTGVQVVSENNYGRPDNALNYLKRITRTFSYALPGSIYEVSPDYGMITQAWNIYSYAIPIIQQFFGIKPNAAVKTITVEPQMPTEWDIASLENVLIGDNSISVFYERSATSLVLRVEQTNPDWNVVIVLPEHKDAIYSTSSTEAKQIISQNKVSFSFSSASIEIQAKYN